MISKVDILINHKTFGVSETSVKTIKIVAGTDATLWRSVHKEYNSELQYKTYIGFNKANYVSLMLFNKTTPLPQLEYVVEAQ